MKFSKLVGFLSLFILFAITTGMTVATVQDEENKSETKTTEVEKGKDSHEFKPVDNMHHFMEYVCEPSYKALKEMLKSEPADRKAWKKFKNHALVLAETSALVAERAPEENAKEWKDISFAVYQSGTSLYKSAGKFDEAKKHYRAMIDNCNQCHTVFEKGKHQLEK